MPKRLAPLLALGLLLILPVACSTTPVPDPDGDDRAVLGVQARIDSPNRGSFGTNAAPSSGAYFVRVSKDGDPTRVSEVFETNFSAGSTQYLFNAPPGRWALVAVAHRHDGREVRTYLNQASIRASVQDVKPGHVAFFGTYRVRARFDTESADDAQKRYFRLIDPKLYKSSILQRMIARSDAQFERSHSRDKDAEHFLERTSRLVEETPWNGRLFPIYSGG